MPEASCQTLNLTHFSDWKARQADQLHITEKHSSGAFFKLIAEMETRDKHAIMDRLVLPAIAVAPVFPELSLAPPSSLTECHTCPTLPVAIVG